MQARIKDFVCAFYSRFGLAMSGGTATLIFGLFGFFKGGQYAQTVFFVLAGCSFTIASFAIWREERLNRIRLQNELSTIKENFNALEIEFNPQNPFNEYWSFEAKDDGFGHKFSCKEYRVKIINKSKITVCDVHIYVRLMGISAHRPILSNFDANGQKSCDIAPDHFELAPVLQYVVPPLPGTSAGDTARAEGPLEVRITGRNVATVKRLFKFDPELEPMIYD